MSRSALALAVLVLAAGLAACGEKSTPEAAPSSPAAVASSSPAPSATVEANIVEVSVTVEGSKVTPKPSTVKVEKGQVLRLSVTTDAADEIHVHGYDKALETAAGRPGVLEFTADRTGRFEVETHESGLLLFQLQVS